MGDGSLNQMRAPAKGEAVIDSLEWPDFLPKSSSLEQFRRRHLGYGEPEPLNDIGEMSTLRELLTGWPARAVVDQYLASLERQLLPERAEAQAEESRKMEDVE